AVPEAVWRRRFRTIKELGANALRFAHNPPPREVLDLCDEYGFLVMDEAFDKWEMGATGWASWLENIHPRFGEDWQKDLDAMILRDRNHPSIVMWSVGNEVMEYCRDPQRCVETYRKLAKRTKELDPTRPVSQALIYTTNREDALHESGLADEVDFLCLNYQEFNYPHDRERQPGKLILGTETRMFFGVPRKKANAGDAMDEGELDVGIGDVSRKAMYLPENPWQAVERHDYVIGGLLWSMVDYLGEASWPNRGWSGGIIDTAGYAKTWANYFACAWSDEPRVRIQIRDNSLPIPMGRTSWEAPKSIDHWNWPEMENDLVLVETPTNCDSVELVLNGDSCGKRKTAYSKNNTIEWWVPYETGKLEAFGYDGEGEKVCEWSLETSGPATALRVTLDREQLCGDGHDVVHADVAFVDDAGREVRTEFKPVNFFVSGHGELLGIDTGNIRCHESYVGQRRTSYFGRCVGLVRARRGEGVINIRVSSKGFPTVSVEIPVA
ncbi:MAG: glycoside hydrolase family 2 TIM barrel-domain containing protein, partial [bacterium]